MQLSIPDIIRREAGTYRDLDIPPKDTTRPGKWLRLPCPFCGRSGRHPPAVVNYEVGWFCCHACGKRLSTSYDTSAAVRFTTVLRQASFLAWRKFPGVLTLDEARSHANERLAVYAGPGDGAWAESGALELWEKKAADLEDRLDSYVLKALKDDLWDYARKLIRAKEREQPIAAGLDERNNADDWRTAHFISLLESKNYKDWEYAESIGRFSQQDYPLLYALKVEGMTRGEMEKLLRNQLGWTQQEFRNRLEGEKRVLAQAFYQDQHGRP